MQILTATLRNTTTASATTTSQLNLNPPPAGRRTKLDWLIGNSRSSGGALSTGVRVHFGSALHITNDTVGSGVPLRFRAIGPVAGGANIPVCIQMIWPDGTGPELSSQFTDPQVSFKPGQLVDETEFSVGYHYE